MTHMSTVLIVDDEPTGRDILEGILLDRGYHLAFACHGAEALEMAARLMPDLILLDVMMPGMDGFTVCQRIRADALLNSIPIIMITALDDQDSRLRGIEAGADDFISKPVDRTELRARVRTITRLNRYRRLLTERTRFEWVVENTETGYLVVHPDDRIIYANAIARHYLGFASSAEAYHAPFGEQVGKTYRLLPAEAWKNWPDPTDPPLPRYLVLPETTSRRAFWLQVDVMHLPVSTSEYMVRLRDVTDQVTRQQDMQGFHTIISHKLRTPISGLISGLNFLVEELQQLGDEGMLEFAEIAQLSAQRLFSDIEDITGYLRTASMASAGPGFRLGDVQALVTELCTSLEIASYTVTVPPDLHDSEVILTRQSIEVIFWEILENARKFHPDRAPVVEVAVKRVNETEVAFTIADNGLMLSPVQLASAFLPYYQGEKVFTGEVQGMGLGLSTVARLLWGAGGTCSMHNREAGPGVVVCFSLPLRG